jgi:WD40 repeat protein
MITVPLEKHQMHINSRWILILSLLSFSVFLPSHTVAQNTCGDAPPPRLRIDHDGVVLPGLPNNVRAAPQASANRVTQIPGDATFTVLNGPVCDNGFYWYEVEYEDTIGWTVEGADGEYWVTPLLFDGVRITPDTIADMQEVGVLPCPQGTPRILSWSPDTTKVAVACQFDSSAVIYDLLTMESTELQGLTRLDDFTGFFEFTDDGRYIAGFERGNSWYYWDAATGERLDSTPDDSALWRVKISDGQIDQQDVITQTVRSLTCSDPAQRVIGSQSVALSPNCNYAATIAVGDSSDFTLWDLTDETHSVFSQLDTPGHYTTRGITFSPSGRFVVVSDCRAGERGDCYDSVISWFHIETESIVTNWVLDGFTPHQFSFSLDGSLMTASHLLGTHVFDIATDVVLYESEMNSGRFSPDGRLLLLFQPTRGVVLLGIPE